jgi:hypothetical protein
MGVLFFGTKPLGGNCDGPTVLRLVCGLGRIAPQTKRPPSRRPPNWSGSRCAREGYPFTDPANSPRTK